MTLRSRAARPRHGGRAWPWFRQTRAARRAGYVDLDAAASKDAARLRPRPRMLSRARRFVGRLFRPAPRAAPLSLDANGRSTLRTPAYKDIFARATPATPRAARDPNAPPGPLAPAPPRPDDPNTSLSNEHFTTAGPGILERMDAQMRAEQSISQPVQPDHARIISEAKLRIQRYIDDHIRKSPKKTADLRHIQDRAFFVLDSDRMPISNLGLLYERVRDAVNVVLNLKTPPPLPISAAPDSFPSAADS